METIYLNTRSAGRQEAPILDLNEYRRKLERQWARQVQAETVQACRQEENASDQDPLRALLRSCRRPESLGELMDVAASAAMVLTALVAAVVVLV